MAVQGAQLVLRRFERGAAFGAEPLACAVDVEREHGHRRTERVDLAAAAPVGRALQRLGDRPRALLSEHPGLEIERVAGLGHPL
jgi:hypothetical protein